ncbi:ATP-dependent DNA helicase PIF1 [Metarhizium rileyi]|uniref:ATP-dependent DNA helicase PIF1 n=1 Tax=Metarhizium rileyi (strain RCEF 4871) TaxID=1649241 RepID=A0A166XW86_METRR|nr:ATP-dependent DNA helicase PIF1 [Metarhizium rileyi RCEF 4871]
MSTVNTDDDLLPTGKGHIVSSSFESVLDFDTVDEAQGSHRTCHAAVLGRIRATSHLAGPGPLLLAYNRTHDGTPPGFESLATADNGTPRTLRGLRSRPLLGFADSWGRYGWQALWVQTAPTSSSFGFQPSLPLDRETEEARVTLAKYWDLVIMTWDQTNLTPPNPASSSLCYCCYGSYIQAFQATRCIELVIVRFA